MRRRALLVSGALASLASVILRGVGFGRESAPRTGPRAGSFPNAILRTHANKPGWLFLTGKPGDVEKLRRKLGFVDPDPAVDKDKSQHIGVILYGNETLDRWAACPALTDPTEIVRYVLWMEPKNKQAAD